MRTQALVLLAIPLLLTVGCSRKKPEVAVPPATTTATPAPPPSATPSTPPDLSGSDAAANRRALEERIFFEYDQSRLTPEAETILRAKVPVLLANRSITLQIEGHADERGSDEYNFVLGTRRAAEAKRFLVRMGVDDARLSVISLGEEQPLDRGTNEASWARNRRGEFRITAGMPFADR